MYSRCRLTADIFPLIKTNFKPLGEFHQNEEVFKNLLITNP